MAYSNRQTTHKFGFLVLSPEASGIWHCQTKDARLKRSFQSGMPGKAKCTEESVER